MPTSSGVSIFNYIRENSSSTFQDIVPTATSENILTLANILFDQSYTPQLNEFVSNLINRIGYTMVHNKVFSNPLAMFKKGSVPLGTDIQDIFTNPAQAEDYEYSNSAMAKLLTITDPDTHVAYYRRNRKDLYTVTVSREGLQGAFVSWGKFEDYISSLMNSLYNGDYIDEFRYTKELILGAYDNNKAIVQVVDAPDSESDDKALVKKLREIYTMMKFPSTNYNAYSKMSGSSTPVTTWTDESRIVLLITASVMAEIDVEVLAAAFNMDKADFLGRVIVVDTFGDDKILGCLCDEAFLQIYNNQFRFDEFYNARTMSWNFYLHAWDTFAISPFANAVIFATAASKPVTAISISDQTLDLSDEATTGKSVTVTLTPSGATSDIDFVSSDTTLFTVEKVSNTSIKLYPKKTGTGGVLTATADNGISTTADVTVQA